MRIVMPSGCIVPLMRPYDYTPNIEDIASVLSTKPRFNGCFGRYSVAQHSVLVSDLLPPQLKFRGLMHDAHEAFAGDVSSPHKQLFRHTNSFYDDFEHGWASRIRTYYQIPIDLGDAVKQADLKAMSIEIASLCHPIAISSFIELGVYPEYSRDITVLSPQDARAQFLERVTMYSQWIT